MSTLQEAITNREHDDFCRDLDALFETHKTRFLSTVEVGGWDSTLEALLLGIGAVIRRDAVSQEHPLVKECLDVAAENVRSAAFNYYASWK